MILDVWKGLIRHGYQSCPVLNKKKRNLYGFIDLSDIVQYFSITFEEATLNNTIDFLTLADSDEKFKKMTVQDLIINSTEMASKNSMMMRLKLMPVHKSFSLYFALECMARDLDIQRIPIVDSEMHLKNLITQSQLLEFIGQNIGKIGSKKLRTVGNFNSNWKHHFAIVSEMDSALSAFRKMMKTKSTVVGVVSSNDGSLKYVISQKDLKLIAWEQKFFSKLFLASCTFSELLEKSTEKRPKYLITCTEAATLERVILELCHHKIHNIFVVEAMTNHPIGVVTINHILHEILID